MSVSVSMPQLGESVTEGTVTRWLKKVGDRVETDEPLLEVSTDKVDTEIPSPTAGVLSNIAVGEDETVEVGAELATIDEGGDGGGTPAAAPQEQAAAPAQEQAAPAQEQEQAAPAQEQEQAAPAQEQEQAVPAQAQQEQAAPQEQEQEQAAPAQAQQEQAAPQEQEQEQEQAAPQAAASPAAVSGQQPSAPPSSVTVQEAPPPAGPSASVPSAASSTANPPDSETPRISEQAPPPAGSEGPYVTPLVRKLAAEHDVSLDAITGTGVGGRIRKQDVLDAAREKRAAGQAAPPAADGGTAAPKSRPAVVPSALRGTTERLSRARQVIAQRMVESLQTSAQLTTVVEADVTAIARLRERARGDFEAREGVKLSFLPFFALATVEALKTHPKLNAVIDTVNSQVTYHEAEHLGVAVDTERGLMVPVVRDAGDLNLGGLARKIANVADRTRSGQVGPEELAGGTFTLTNTGSRGALFDTPIINQPQVGILGTGIVVKRPAVVADPTLGEVIAIRSFVYLALTYDHRLVDGADAARFLTTVKDRLEEGAFETDLGR